MCLRLGGGQVDTEPLGRFEMMKRTYLAGPRCDDDSARAA